MMNKIRERLSWDADCTILLVRFILATVIIGGAVWYSQYGGQPGVANHHSATIEEVVAMVVADFGALILFGVKNSLPFLGIALIWLGLCVIKYCLDLRKSWKAESQVERDIEGD